MERAFFLRSTSATIDFMARHDAPSINFIARCKELHEVVRHALQRLDRAARRAAIGCAHDDRGEHRRALVAMRPGWRACDPSNSAQAAVRGSDRRLGKRSAAHAEPAAVRVLRDCHKLFLLNQLRIERQSPIATWQRPLSGLRSVAR
jgi:hypothetical protein